MAYPGSSLSTHSGRPSTIGCGRDQPASGGKQIMPDMVQTTEIMSAARLGVRLRRYEIARVMDQWNWASLGRTGSCICSTNKMRVRLTRNGSRDGPVAVETDKTEVQYGCGAEQNVGRQPELAEHVTEHPVPHQLGGQRQRHYEQADQEVAYCQWRDEPVLNALESTVCGDCDDDQTIAEHDADDDDAHSNSSDCHTQPFVTPIFRTVSSRWRRVDQSHWCHCGRFVDSWTHLALPVTFNLWPLSAPIRST